MCVCVCVCVCMCVCSGILRGFRKDCNLLLSWKAFEWFVGRVCEPVLGEGLLASCF